MLNETEDVAAAPVQVTVPERHERPGAAYFRLRGWIPIPFYAAIVFLPWRSPRAWASLATGLSVVLLGCLYRIWAIRFIGHRARTHSQKTRPLVMEGPYAAHRNPLYVANILIAVGLTLGTGLLWYAPVLAILLLIHYHLVVLCEESGLRERHNASYEEFCARVPRWFPQLLRRDVWLPARFPIAECLYREKSGILGMLAATSVLVAWAWWRMRPAA